MAENYYKLQENISHIIAKAYTNFKKASKERKGTVSYVATKLETLEDNWKEFTICHRKIILETKKEDYQGSAYCKDEVYENTEEMYIDYKSALKECLMKLKPAPSASSEVSNNSSKEFKLPKIEIPKFSGTNSEWASFRDSFRSMIHKNSNIDNVQKLHYLKGSLSGEAAKLLNRYPITADNYLVCWAQLEGRYDNKKFLANSLLSRLVNQKSLTTATVSSVTLIDLLDTTQECLSQIESLGVRVKTWDIMIIFLISQKLDPASREIWEQKVAESPEELPTMAMFEKFLKDRSRSTQYKDKPNEEPTTITHIVSHIVCIFCNDNHKIANCKKFAQKTSDERCSFAQTNHLCFNCLNPEHSVYDCRLSTRCRLCKKKHHTLLHPKTQKPVNGSVQTGQANKSVVTTTTVSSVQCTDDQAPSTSEVSDITSCHLNAPSQVLLPTALVNAKSCRNGASVALRSLLDQGSQASFVTESAVQILGLKKLSETNLISGLGGDRGSTISSKSIVILKIQSRLDPTFILSVRAHVLDKLTCFLPRDGIDSVSSLFATLELADPFLGSPNKIDLLLGAEVYSQILLDGLVKDSPSSVIAQKTKLGWILSGTVTSAHNHSDYGHSKHCNIVSMHITDDNELLKKFWEMKSEPSRKVKHLTTEELKCYSVEEGVFVHSQLKQLLDRGSFPLQKWASNRPNRWQTFVANRMPEVLTLTEATQWSPVASQDNPADCASRGVMPSECTKIDIWNRGPQWLHLKEIKYSKSNLSDTDLEEKKSKVKVHTLTCVSEGESLLTRFSSLRLQRVLAWCMRAYLPRSQTNQVWLTATELSEVMTLCIKVTQSPYFTINDLEHRKSKFASLNPFKDANGIWRVGDRLQKSDLPEDRKHPVLIAYLAKLITADAHERTLHGGPQLAISDMHSKYWIVNLRNLVKSFIHKCVTCLRYSSQAVQPLMSQLPSARITSDRPFRNSGVDYAGPISVRSSKGRGNHSTKGYICLFVCMVTRAGHLEVVSDLTSAAFIAAFKRFVARRGHCAELWSDNATTFVGADRELKALVESEISVVTRDITEWLATNGTNWHRIPPYSPNFGGLWEAGIKSTKNHLKKVIGESTLTFEELTTVLAQIEACLNSRPVTRCNDSSSEDPYPLTPGHFLVGEPLVLVPDNNYETSNVSSLRRWQLTQRMVQMFWRKWSQEYLTQFLQRYKWKELIAEPEIGDVVLVKEDGLPPSRWLYGVITDKHTGSDKVTRVVSLRSKGSIIKRPVSKIVKLPVNDD